MPSSKVISDADIKNNIIYLDLLVINPWSIINQLLNPFKGDTIELLDLKTNLIVKVNTHTFTCMLGLSLTNPSCKNYLNDPK